MGGYRVAIAEDSAKKAADARELLRLKKNEEGVLRAKAVAAPPPTPQLNITAHVAPESPNDDVFGALAIAMEMRRPNHLLTCLRRSRGISENS